VNCACQFENLVGQLDQLPVLLVLFLHHLVLLVGGGLSLEVGAVLADHHERRQEDRLERHDHRQQPVRVTLDPEDDPDREPDDVEIYERHRAGEPSDHVGNPILDARGTRLGVFGQSRVERHGQLRGYKPPVRRVCFGV
jgi:hypothetical protein